MTTLNKKLLPAVAMAVALFASAQAEAATYTTYTAPTSMTGLDYNKYSDTANGDTTNWISFRGAIVSTLLVGDVFSNQGLHTVEHTAETIFNLDLTQIDYQNSLSAEGWYDIGGKITNDVGALAAYNYVAIHFGSGNTDTLFQLSSLIHDSHFSVKVNNNSLSNFRAYSGGVSAVPVPAAVWLFGSALLGLTGVTRSKKTNTAVVEA